MKRLKNILIGLFCLVSTLPIIYTNNVYAAAPTDETFGGASRISLTQTTVTVPIDSVDFILFDKGSQTVTGSTPSHTYSEPYTVSVYLGHRYNNNYACEICGWYGPADERKCTNYGTETRYRNVSCSGTSGSVTAESKVEVTVNDTGDKFTFDPVTMNMLSGDASTVLHEKLMGYSTTGTVTITIVPQSASKTITCHSASRTITATSLNTGNLAIYAYKPKFNTNSFVQSDGNLTAQKMS